FDRDDLPTLAVDDGSQILFGETSRCMLLEEALALGAIRTTDQRKRPPDHVRRHPAPYLAIEISEILLGDADIDPVHPYGMGEADVAFRPGLGMAEPRLRAALIGFGCGLRFLRRIVGRLRRLLREFGSALRFWLLGHDRYFSHDFCRWLVVTHAFEGSLAQYIIGGPPPEMRLDDNF